MKPQQLLIITLLLLQVLAQKAAEAKADLAVVLTNEQVGEKLAKLEPEYGQPILENDFKLEITEVKLLANTVSNSQLCLSQAELETLKNFINIIDFKVPLYKLRNTPCNPNEFDDRVCDRNGYWNSLVEANLWTITGSKFGAKISCCPGIGWLLGGYNVFGVNAIARKQFFKFPQARIYVKFDLYLLDSWDAEFFQVIVNGNGVVYQRQHHQYWFPGYPDYAQHQFLFGESQSNPNCGWKRPGFTNFDKKIQVNFNFVHTSPILQIQLKSTLDQDAGDESWGVKNLCIYQVRLGRNLEEINSNNYDEFD